MIDLDLFFQFLKGRCHGNKFWAKLAKGPLINSAGWCSETGRNMAFLIQKWQYCSYIVCSFDQDWFRYCEGNNCTRWQKSAYPTKYLGKYQTNLNQLFSVGRSMTPSYLWEYCQPLSSVVSRLRRSAHSGRLSIPRTRMNYGDCSFAVQGPRTWNSLPADLQAPDMSIETFRHKLKSFLFAV